MKRKLSSQVRLTADSFDLRLLRSRDWKGEERSADYPALLGLLNDMRNCLVLPDWLLSSVFQVYGIDQKELWCTQCKWKKACGRFTWIGDAVIQMERGEEEFEMWFHTLVFPSNLVNWNMLTAYSLHLSKIILLFVTLSKENIEGNYRVLWSSPSSYPELDSYYDIFDRVLKDKFQNMKDGSLYSQVDVRCFLFLYYWLCKFSTKVVCNEEVIISGCQASAPFV